MTTTSVDMVKFGEFMRSLPVPTSLHIFKMDPLRGHAIFVLESKLVFNLVETFFGGAGGGEVKIEGRDFTAIEQQLTRKVVMMSLKDMEQAWKPVHELSMVYQRTEINPQFASIVPPSDVVIVVKFELEMEHTAGTITVCIPYSTVEPIRSKLYAGFQSDQLEVDHEWMRRFRTQLRDAQVDVTVELGRAMIKSGDLLNLQVGEVLTLDKDVNEPLVAMVEGVPKFRGRAGMHRGNKAFKVERFL
jgi:flagellar motor switch protein FliM